MLDCVVVVWITSSIAANLIVVLRKCTELFEIDRAA